MAEWSIAPVLKTGDGKPSVSSNLTASAKAAFHAVFLFPVLTDRDEPSTAYWTALASATLVRTLRWSVFGRRQHSDMRAEIGFGFLIVGLTTASTQDRFRVFALFSGLLAPVLSSMHTILLSLMLCATSLLAMTLASNALVVGPARAARTRQYFSPGYDALSTPWKQSRSCG